MEAIINLITYLMMSGPRYAPYVDICESRLDNLSLEKKIEFSIGCCSVNGNRLLKDYELKEILGDEVQGGR